MTDLIQFLQNCPRGRKLYSPIFGEVTFARLLIGNERPVIVDVEENRIATFFADGRYSDTQWSECLLFPSKECRDWCAASVRSLAKKGDYVQLYNAKVVIFDGTEEQRLGIMRFASKEEFENYGKIGLSHNFDFKPFDKVIVCDGLKDVWGCSIYSHSGELKNLEGFVKKVHCVVNGVFNHCLPFEGNEHLVGQVFSEEHLK